MAKFINKKIVVEGREWLVFGMDEYLEVFFVQECGRKFKTMIGFEEVA